MNGERNKHRLWLPVVAEMGWWPVDGLGRAGAGMEEVRAWR
jgi:hypothetical protein